MVDCVDILFLPSVNQERGRCPILLPAELLSLQRDLTTATHLETHCKSFSFLAPLTGGDEGGQLGESSLRGSQTPDPRVARAMRSQCVAI